MMSSITFNNTRFHLNGAMEEWCRDNIGSGGWTQMREVTDWTALGKWRMHSMFGNTTFIFKDTKDYTMFLLRWS
jgi:hypothetical protein